MLCMIAAAGVVLGTTLRVKRGFGFVTLCYRLQGGTAPSCAALTTLLCMYLLSGFVLVSSSICALVSEGLKHVLACSQIGNW